MNWADRAYSLGRGVCAIRGESLLDTKFIRYCLDFKLEALLKLASGGTFPNLTKDTISGFEIPYPDTRDKIAAILSAYDELIEVNARRMRILEEMAQSLYREWFVRLRFPGHESARWVESALGRIPEGWEVKRLGELLEHHIGGGWGEESASEEFPVSAYVIRGTDVPDVRKGSLGDAPLRFHKESNFRTRKLQAGDIVFEVSGGSKDQPVGRSVIVSAELLRRAVHPVICASFCRLVRADSGKILPNLLNLHFAEIYENREIMKYQTQSTGITNFKFMVFLEREEIVVPSLAVQAKFDELTSPMLESAALLGAKNANLRATRDLLLPRLISGEVEA
jgi:type I restriction enzyme S subunit